MYSRGMGPGWQLALETRMLFLMATIKIHESCPWLLNKANDMHSCHGTTLFLRYHLFWKLQWSAIAQRLWMWGTAWIFPWTPIKACEFFWWGSQRVNIEKYLLLCWLINGAYFNRGELNWIFFSQENARCDG